MKLEWSCKKFSEFTKQEFYNILVARQKVFIIEQNCNYLDCDNKDEQSYHLLGMDKNNIASYMRIIPPGISYKDASMGRILTTSKYRGKGLGKLLMKEGISLARKKFKISKIKISAQSYLLPFYKSFGFVAQGKEYLEDDIPHTEMVLLL